MTKIKEEALTLEKLMNSGPTKKSIDRCEYFANMDDTPDVAYCYQFNCKDKKLCEMRTNEKLNILTGKTKGLDKFGLEQPVERKE